MKIGVIAENSNDFRAITGLLNKQYTEIEFFEMLAGKNGSNLDDRNSNIITHLLAKQFRIEEPDFVLYIRDLDGFQNDKTLVKFKKERFAKLRKTVEKRAIFMLNIYEIEALILADFDVFKNYHKNTTWVFDEKTAAETLDPKGVLEQFAQKKANINELIPQLRIDILEKNHTHFRIFSKEFQKMVQGRIFRAVPI